MSGRVARSAVALVLALAVLAAGAVLAGMLLDDGGPEGTARTTSAAAPASVVTSSGAWTSALAAGTSGAELVLGYSWRTLDEDVAAARGAVTGQMREQYDDTMGGLAERVVADRTTVAASAVGSSVVSVTEDEATVLVFVNERTTGADLDRPRVELDRVLLTLSRVDGEWLVSELDVL